MEHAFFVTHDDLRRHKLDKPLEPVVSVDYPAIQVVQVAGGEPSAVKLHHRAQFRRQDRQSCQNHPVGLVPTLAEGLDDTKALDRLLAALSGGGLHFVLQSFANLFEVHAV